jgi:2-polyprenyl-3-methyl-5-hydroxy-6-metoxy-1,4-benzoquinol methylase
MDSNNLTFRRISAAEGSRGISSDVIYTAILGVLDTKGLSGIVLDFGAGIGNLSRLLCGKDSFSQVIAADILDRAASNQSHPKLSWLTCDLNKSIPAQDESYDAIVSCEVIEHLENPRFLAREWYRLLKPGGCLVVSTPNNESWRSIISLVLRGHFAYFTGASYPAHITALLRMDLQRILSEAGFEHVTFSFTNDGTIPKLPWISWQSVSLGFLKGLRYSDNVVCAASKPSLKADSAI